MATINKYNFLRWKKPNDNTVSELPKPYRKDKGCYAPVLVPGETTSFYINCNFTQDFQFTVRLLKNNVAVTADLVVLSKVETENGFELYGSIVNPNVSKGHYNLGVFVNGALVLISNQMFVMTSGYDKVTALIKFRHDRSLYGFNYDLVPEFYQQFRVHLSEIDRQYDYNKDQYRSEISGRLRNFYSTTDRFVKFETYYFDDGAHEAIACMIDHEEVFINNEQFAFKNGYKQDVDLISSISKGEFEMWESKFSSDNRSDNDNEVIFSGLGYYSQPASGVFSKNNCPAGNTTNPVTYYVAGNAYFSNISQAAADQMAINDVNTNGQAYANENGVCIPNYFTDADGEIFTDSDNEEFI